MKEKISRRRFLLSAGALIVGLACGPEKISDDDLKKQARLFFDALINEDEEKALSLILRDAKVDRDGLRQDIAALKACKGSFYNDPLKINPNTDIIQIGLPFRSICKSTYIVNGKMVPADIQGMLVDFSKNTGKNILNYHIVLTTANTNLEN